MRVVFVEVDQLHNPFDIDAWLLREYSHRMGPFNDSKEFEHQMRTSMFAIPEIVNNDSTLVWRTKYRIERARDAGFAVFGQR